MYLSRNPLNYYVLYEPVISKIAILVLSLLLFVAASGFFLRRYIRNYNAVLWGSVELFWYLGSFVAVCVGLLEIDRLERLNRFNQQEKALALDYESKKGLLYAQTMLLKSEKHLTPEKTEGQRWFHKMRALFDEGLYTRRWEGFVHYSDCYIFGVPGCYTDVNSNAQEYDWPKDTRIKMPQLFLKDEIRWVVDSLKNLETRKYKLLAARPEDSANFELRYYLVGLYLAGLSLKIVKIYADFRRIKGK